MSSKEPISVVIPAYNEEERISSVLEDVPSHFEVIVVNDGSDDNTEKEARQFEDEGVKVLRHEENKGKGVALSTGAKEATGNILVFLDADGQHPPKHIPELVKPIQEKEADIVVGNRFAEGFSGAPYPRRLSNYFSSVCIKKITGQKIEDPLCGYRALRKDLWEKMECGQGFEVEIELLIQASEKNCNIENKPIDLIYNDKRSHLKKRHSLKLTLKLMRALGASSGSNYLPSTQSS